jgi:O-antigen/teichoic acid export membrane protein
MSILGSHIIILLIYGTAFQQTASLLIGFSFATIIIAINFVYGSLLTIQHHNRDRVIIQAIVACVHIIGTWYGMIYYGLFGAVV